ncbi:MULTISPECIES: hypothetical protein [Rhizobium/Agrobacterium group]|jgi:hypothetical protein|uniref:hypothetical protein n=1 Tax=Rhizobium/Agrobacterium group TaxID=227290 RepID=UPI0008A7A369|nr:MULTISPECIES: hypothetical protein [Rhizobium/Agrobacterium group]RYE66313.1 MAG: hypothetical protein EOP17_11660 [Rhizobiaceae bacterium]MBD8651301.1 hypothetical protein [Rhizobium sp. CFBP 13726]MBD8662420.1 hypothetical protein [Rhizobium sp. CFBP 8752]MBP2461917.1 hypothetical protein [Rhizobium sp. PvP014]MBP2529312.1 hypothetical protein [Rhizobium sp. PvP099]
MPQPEVEEKEEPLDPAMERIRRKMVLLQLVSGGILFVCFMAVLAAIVYKISQRPADGPATVATSGSFTVPSDQPLKATAALPTGFQIDNVSMSGSQLVFLGQLNGARKVFVFDIVLGRIVADVTIATGP